MMVSLMLQPTCHLIRQQVAGPEEVVVRLQVALVVQVGLPVAQVEPQVAPFVQVEQDEEAVVQFVLEVCFDLEEAAGPCEK